MARIIGNFNEDGSLEKLHLNPRESCNVDDAKDKRELAWAEAFEEVSARLAVRRIKGGPVEVEVSSIKGYLCAHCDFAEDDRRTADSIVDNQE